MPKGKFIVFEGIDGSGKSTQIQLLNEKLTKRSTYAYLTCEPSNRPIGQLIRKILHKEIQTTNDVLAGLYFSDRLDHLKNAEDGILQKLEEGIMVISDRYYMSSLAYNSLNSSIFWVFELNKICMETLRPDLTIYLDLSVEESLSRIKVGRESEELFDKNDVLKRVKSNYEEAIKLLSPQEKIITINADQDPEWIGAEIWEEVEKIA